MTRRVENWGVQSKQPEEEKIPRRRTGAVGHPKTYPRLACGPPAQYGHGRTRAVPSLPQVLVDNGLPEIAPLPRGETIMLESKKLDRFYRELQVPSRIEANTRKLQTEEKEENTESQLTQS